MIHYILQKQCCIDDDSFDFPLIYSFNGHSLHSGRREFCLITGFKFGSLSFREYRNGDILFRNWLFSEKIGYDVKIIDVLALIEDEEKFSKVIDEDIIRLCLLLSLVVIFIGRELVSVVDDVFFRIVDNLDARNSFPWGEHIWRQLYDAIRNVSSKHKLEHLDGLRKPRNYVPSYSLSGFLFAFKLESLKKVQLQFSGYLEDQYHLHFSLCNGTETEDKTLEGASVQIGQWTPDERKAANLDQRLKSLIMSVLPDDQVNSVINFLTAKSAWDDLILYHEGPSDVKESMVMDLKFCYNTFEFKEDSPDDEEDTGSSQEYMDDLEEEYQAKALLAKSKRFFKKDEEEVSSDDNEMVEVKVLMALVDDNDAV
ncbi:phospholipase-like, aminotransferase-like mobile domain protein, partial [Tanacetum coccineum]